MAKDKNKELMELYTAYEDKYRFKWGLSDLGRRTFREWLESNSPDDQSIMIKLANGRIMQIRKTGFDQFYFSVGRIQEGAVTGHKFIDTSYSCEKVYGKAALCDLILLHGFYTGELLEFMNWIIKAEAMEIICRKGKNDRQTNDTRESEAVQ